MNVHRRNPLGTIVDFYLDNRALQGAVAFAASGLSGGAVGLLFASIVSGSLFWSVVTASVVAAVFAVWGWHSAMARSWRRQYRSETFFGPWLGAAILFGAAGTVLGITGWVNILLALVLSSFVSFWLVLAPEPEPNPNADR